MPTAPASSFVDAAIGMEQIGKIEPAHRAYGTALRRWPDNLLARAGLGNTAYALGEFSAAETAYREALAIDPRRADLWNNLAYALRQLGRHEASLQAVRRAVELEPDNQNFQDSLRELGGSQ